MSDQEQLVESWKRNPLEAFKAGVRLGFSRWDALDDAIEFGWGGRDVDDKRKMLFDDMIELFTKSSWSPNITSFTHPFQEGKVYPDQVRDYLDDVLAEDFHTEACDGTTDWVS